MTWATMIFAVGCIYGGLILTLLYALSRPSTVDDDSELPLGEEEAPLFRNDGTVD